jgi:hypothetical protein
MNISIKIPLGIKEVYVPDTAFYTWYINNETKTFSLTRKSDTLKFSNIKSLLSEGYIYEY